MDAQILQEVMEKVSQLQRKEEDLHQQLTAPNTRLDMEQVYVVKSRSVHTQLLRAIEKENNLERYLAFEQSHGGFFSALHELILATSRTVQENYFNMSHSMRKQAPTPCHLELAAYEKIPG